MNRAKPAAAVSAVLAAGLLLAGCGGTDKALTDLQSDPLATATLPGTKLVRQFKVGSGTAMGKPVHADITREFRVLPGVPAGRPLAAAKRTAVQNGWRLSPFTVPGGFIARKTIRSTRAELTVTISHTHEDKLVVDIVAY